MAWKELLLAAGILSGQSDSEIIKFVDKHHVSWNDPISLGTCKAIHKNKDEGIDDKYKYRTAHERYWDAKMGHKGADRAYHKKHDKEFGPDRNHDGKPDCKKYEEELEAHNNKDEIKAQEKAERQRKAEERIAEINKDYDKTSKERSSSSSNGGMGGGLMGLIQEAFKDHHK